MPNAPLVLLWIDTRPELTPQRVYPNIFLPAIIGSPMLDRRRAQGSILVHNFLRVVSI